VLSTQEGAEGASAGGGGFLGLGGGDSGVFLLPLGPVAASIEQARKRAPEVIAKAREAAAKAAEGAPPAEGDKPAEPAPAPAPSPDAPK
jgi:hypothetical protein